MSTKAKMLQHLVDGKPPFYVEAELELLWGTVFIGFEPAPDVNLTWYITGGSLVLPRSEFPSDEKALHYVNVMRQLRDAAKFSHTLPYFFVERKTPFWSGLCEISWYNYFNDEVSLQYCDNPSAYVVISRKELLDGPVNPQLVEP